MASSSADAAPSIEDVVDGRVEGAIEALNSAMLHLNTLEDTRSAAALAAQRASVVVTAELAELDKAQGKLVQKVEPFLETRALAAAAIKASREADAQWLEYKEQEASARDEKKRRPRGDLYAKLALDDAASKAKEAKRVAARAGRSAEGLAIKLGEMGFAIERAGFAIEDAISQYAEYKAKRDDLEGVLEMSYARLRSLDAAKDEANASIASAMDNLESLNIELHDAEPGSPDEAAARRSIARISLNNADIAAWRSARFSDDEDEDEDDSDDGKSDDSYAGEGFSESEEADAEQEHVGSRETAPREII